MKMPRIALFSDSYHEANDVARTAFAIEACAKRRNIPFLSVHAGPETRLVHDGSIVRLDLKRSSVFSFGLEHDLRFDLAMWRISDTRQSSSNGLRLTSCISLVLATSVNWARALATGSAFRWLRRGTQIFTSALRAG